MKHSTGTPTKAERAHLAAVKALPCVACLMEGNELFCGLTEVHHLLLGNRRRGHMFVAPLCAWHHRGEPLDGMSAKEMEGALGPSLARSSKRFRVMFGSDDELLARVNELLAQRRAA